MDWKKRAVLHSAKKKTLFMREHASAWEKSVPLSSRVLFSGIRRGLMRL